MQYLLANGKYLSIRQAVAADAAGLLKMFRQAVTESDNLMTTPSEALALTVEQEQEFIASYERSVNQLFLLGEVEGRLAGTLSVTQAKLQQQAHVGEFGIVILRDYWNMGIARRMMTVMQHWTEEHPLIRYLHLSVLSTNEKAIHLYRNFGFQEEGLRPRAVRSQNGYYQDILIMGKWVDPIPGRRGPGKQLRR